jgi:hypothetical protein
MLLPLETFREFLGSHPWHWWGLQGPSIPVVGCDDVTYQFAWQDANRVGRDDISRAIVKAEEIIARDTRISIAPHFVTEEIPYPRHFDHTLMRLTGDDAAGHWVSVATKESWVSKAGVETLSLLANVAVTLSDADGDGVWDTFTTASFATTLLGTQVDEIELYIAAADRINQDPVSSRYSIAPIKVVVNALGSTAVITGPSYLLVKPILQQGVGNKSVDVGTVTPPVITNYVTTLDVYRHYCDPTGTTLDTAQALYTWETAPWPWWGGGLCCGGGNPQLAFTLNIADPAATAQMIARASVRNGDNSNVIYSGQAAYDTTLSQWVASSMGWGRPPDKVLVRYQAGYPLSGGVYTGSTLRNGQVNPKMAKIACMLAAAELPKPIDACTQANRTLQYWQFDIARSSGANDEAYGLTTREMLNCPYGTRRGHIYAWAEMKREEKVLGLSI